MRVKKKVEGIMNRRSFLKGVVQSGSAAVVGLSVGLPKLSELEFTKSSQTMVIGLDHPFAGKLSTDPDGDVITVITTPDGRRIPVSYPYY